MAYQRDYITIRFGDVIMSVRRCNSQQMPHEVTVVIPHAEIRRRFYKDGLVAEEEIIMDTVSIVDAPRHEAARGRRSEPPSLPRATWRYIPAPKD